MNNNLNHNRPPIGVVVSGNSMYRSVRMWLPDATHLNVKNYKLLYVQLNRQDVFFIKADSNADGEALACSLLIESVHPDLILSLGTGVAVNNKMKSADVLYVNAVTMPVEDAPDHYRILSSLRNDVQRFVFDIVFGLKSNMSVGTVITAQNKETLYDSRQTQYPNALIDKSLMHLAQLTARHHITTLALRGVLYNAAPGSFTDLPSLLYFRHLFGWRHLIKTFICKPYLLLRLPANVIKTRHTTNNTAFVAWSLLQVLSVNASDISDQDVYNI